MKKSKPYIQGEKDFKARVGFSKCPYKWGSKAAHDWETAMIVEYNKAFDKIMAKHNKSYQKFIDNNK
jgi:hypothetical protein